MARIARVVVPGYPHHVIQRGNRRQSTFFCDDDYTLYRSLIARACRNAGTEVWAYCMMPNHVHLVLVPGHEDGLRAVFADAHRRYTRHVNFREGWRGHLWQERFHSFPMDERHLVAAVRYVEHNPVTAKLVEQPQHWPWSSARAHLSGKDDELVCVAPMLERIGDWKQYLETVPAARDRDRLRRHSRTGRPLGSEEFVSELEQILKRRLVPLRPGPKPEKRRG